MSTGKIKPAESEDAAGRDDFNLGKRNQTSLRL